MWQFLGLACFLALLALLQLIWPLPLPGLNGAPALLLLAGSLVLWRLPLGRLYGWLLLLAAGFDLLLGEGPLCLIGYAVALSPPLLWPSSEDSKGWLQPLGWMIGSCLLFDAVEALLASRYGLAPWRLLLRHLPWSLMYNTASALLLLPLMTGLISLLHYQRFEYHQDVRKGRLG